MLLSEESRTRNHHEIRNHQTSHATQSFLSIKRVLLVVDDESILVDPVHVDEIPIFGSVWAPRPPKTSKALNLLVLRFLLSNLIDDATSPLRIVESKSASLPISRDCFCCLCSFEMTGTNLVFHSRQIHAFTLTQIHLNCKFCEKKCEKKATYSSSQRSHD